MDEMIKAIGEALGNGRLLAVYAITMILGLVLLKGKRKLFLIPALIMTVVILNPLCMNIWGRFSDYGYWRLLWIIPLIPVIAAVPAAIMEQEKKWYRKLLIVALAAGIIVLSGSFIYSYSLTAFTEAQNADKLPQEVTEIGETLLEFDEEPRIVADHYIATYIREYSGKIKTPYGRDLVFEEPTQYARDVSGNLIAGNMVEVADLMRAGDYRYLVTVNLGADRYEKIEAAGFEYLWQVGEYGIYEIH